MTKEQTERVQAVLDGKQLRRNTPEKYWSGQLRSSRQPPAPIETADQMNRGEQSDNDHEA